MPWDLESACTWGVEGDDVRIPPSCLTSNRAILGRGHTIAVLLQPHKENKVNTHAKLRIGRRGMQRRLWQRLGVEGHSVSLPESLPRVQNRISLRIRGRGSDFELAQTIAQVAGEGHNAKLR